MTSTKKLSFGNRGKYDNGILENKIKDFFDSRKKKKNYCENCATSYHKRHNCVDELFGEDQYYYNRLSQKTIKNSPLNVLVTLSFRFRIKNESETGSLWWKKKFYGIRAFILDKEGREKEFAVISDNGKELTLTLDEANSLVNDINDLISQRQIAGQKQLTQKLQSQKNKEAIEKAAQEAKNQGLHLDPTKYTDIKEYLRDLEEMKKKNQKTIDTLKVSPEEHAAAIARLQQIQAELEKRKKIAQELEQSQIFEKIAQQKHNLELTNKQIDDKAKEVKQAQEAGETAKNESEIDMTAIYEKVSKNFRHGSPKWNRAVEKEIDLARQAN